MAAAAAQSAKMKKKNRSHSSSGRKGKKARKQGGKRGNYVPGDGGTQTIRNMKTKRIKSKGSKRKPREALVS